MENKCMKVISTETCLLVIFGSLHTHTTVASTTIIICTEKSFQQALLDSTWGTCNTERLEKALCLERQQSGAETLVKRYLLADQQLTTMFDTSTIYETRKEIGNARRHTHRLCTHTT